MKEQCDSCEYLGICFWGLKFVQKYVSKELCKQGRKKKELRVKNATGRNPKVEAVKSVWVRNPTTKNLFRE